MRANIPINSAIHKSSDIMMPVGCLYSLQYIFDMQNGIYWERQRGGLCRLHSLNAFFGYNKISDHDFANFGKEFDQRTTRLFGHRASCMDFDTIGSDQLNIVSYILKKHNICTKYTAIGQSKDDICPSNLVNVNRFFVFNDRHIWVMRKNNNQWYKVDSIGGVCRCNPRSLKCQRNVGLIVPINDTKKEFRNIADQIKRTVGSSAESYIVSTIMKKEFLGPLEVLIGRAMEIISIKMNILKNNSDSARYDMFGEISKLEQFYEKYISLVSDGRYNDVALVTHYIVPVIQCICNMSPKGI